MRKANTKPELDKRNEQVEKNPKRHENQRRPSLAYSRIPPKH